MRNPGPSLLTPPRVIIVGERGAQGRRPLVSLIEEFARRRVLIAVRGGAVDRRRRWTSPQGACRRAIDGRLLDIEDIVKRARCRPIGPTCKWLCPRHCFARCRGDRGRSPGRHRPTLRAPACRARDRIRGRHAGAEEPASPATSKKSRPPVTSTNMGCAGLSQKQRAGSTRSPVTG